MKIALLADVHGNREALTAVLKSLRSQGAERIIVLGDIVGYGASPEECTQMLAGLTGDILAGNHDWAAVGRHSSASFNPVAREAIEWTRARLSSRSQALLAALPLAVAEQSFLCVHATPADPAAWDYIFKPDDARANFESCSQQVCFVAHSHKPLIIVRTAQGAVVAEPAAQVALQAGCRYIINVGSVGQPRDGNPHASYGIYDTSARAYQLLRVAYPVAQAQQQIIAAGLPAPLAARLALGR